MSGWPNSRSRILLAAAGAILTAPGCAPRTATAQGPAPTAKERKDLEAAYGSWRRAVTCATIAAPRPVPGAKQEVVRGEAAIGRAETRGLGELIRQIDAEYRRVDATVDWSCGDGDQSAPPGFEAGRLKNLRGAVDWLAKAIESAIVDR